MAQKLPKRDSVEEFEEVGKTMAFDVRREEPDRSEMTLTHSSLYPVRSKLPAFVKNPIVLFSVALLILIGLVFGLLYGLGGSDTPEDTDPPVVDGGEEPAAWRVGGLLEMENISAASIHSDYAILVNLQDMKAVAGLQVQDKMYPASMTKIMTFIVAYEKIADRSVLLEVTKEIKSQHGEGSRVGIEVGDFMTAEQCLMAMILESDTDAVLMLAEHVAGSESAFAALMNEKAQEMGLVSTHFENATGLHHKNHYTTACEMAEIMAYAMQYPLFKEALCTYAYATQLKYYKNGVLTDYTMTFYNSTLRGRLEDNGISTKLAGGGEILGGKTGLTDEAKYCQAALAQDGEGNLYVAILGCAAGAEKSAKDTRWVFNTYLD